MKKRIISLLLVVSMVVAGGCANMLPPQKTVENRFDRQLKSHQLDISTAEGCSVVNNPLLQVTVNSARTYEVKHYEHQTVYDVFTPYQGARELYEVPVGIVTLPVAVAVNLVDFFLLGLVPNSFTDSLLDISFSGLNPFLNIESESRFEKTVVNDEQKLLDQKEEFVRKPLAAGSLTVVAGSASTTYTLDDNGRTEVSLLGSGGDSSQKMQLTAEGDGIKGSLQMDMSRQLCSRLKQAGAITARYGKDLPADLYANGAVPDMKSMGGDIAALSKLGFEKESMELEKKLLPLLKESDQAELRKTIDASLL